MTPIEAVLEALDGIADHQTIIAQIDSEKARAWAAAIRGIMPRVTMTCTFCNGTGRIDTKGISSALYMPCGQCQGLGTIFAPEAQ